MRKSVSIRNFKWIVCVLLLLDAVVVTAQSKNRLYVKYIECYKELAIDHQKRYYIPASITLAQGLLESGAGTGVLALKSNNHFGIKCHNWTGERSFHDDDLKGECFRKYRRVEDSYEDHSKFLRNNTRYSNLFMLKITDYKGWARGLQKAGYATDKAYASKLINLIEGYELYFFDNSKGRKQAEAKEESPYKVYKAYDLLYVEAEAGDTPRKIGAVLGFKSGKLASYNDMPEDLPMNAGDVVYLEKKHRKAEKGFEQHVVQSGESMHSIAQKYGIRLKNFYKMNKQKPGYVPAIGDTLRLR